MGKYYTGANPKGLNSYEVWQTDMTHIMSFGRQRENCQLQLKAKPPVMVKDPATRETEGPHALITWGRGYACVSTSSGPKWVPASTEFQLWEAAWKRLLRDALPGLLIDPETAIDEEGNALTLDHLVGEGRWVAPVDQATTIPPKALQVIPDNAITAFFGMAPEGPIIPYSRIFQEPKESFTSFVERLTQAIELQVPDTAVRPGILREIAFTNANVLSKNAILSLPLDPPPTIPDMLRVCQVKVPLLQAADSDHRPRNPRVAALGSTTSLSSGPSPKESPMFQTNNVVTCVGMSDIGPLSAI
ncbi:hypothetical protein DUI87_18909 [Hirundo rustica rustica]|uniref:Integrase-type domain-containing protein n=1 Tax=Hirundo rustica rustica TaxID=333673 RepID=A0A3M0JUT1_HIRRU|nr:hypothetical protein DUI87_18909 [Hirundo rustica rustica]